jgi:hypothetical protein
LSLERFPDDILLVLPADHVIENIPAFQRAVINAGQLAEQDYLVTFGIVMPRDKGHKRVPDPPESITGIMIFLELYSIVYT